MNDVDVLIIGGGISGLSVAWWLARAGVAVEIWEREPRPGGKIHTVERSGYLTEQAASMVLNFRPEVSRLIERSGLGASKVPRPKIANRYLIQDGKLVALPMKIGPLIASPLWTLRGKLRLLLEPFIRRSGHEEETVSEFITRRLGAEVLEKAMEPFVAATLAADPDRASASAVLPRLTALEKRYGSLTAGVLAHRLLQRRTATAMEGFSFRTGMGALTETLIAERNIRFRPRHVATALERRRSGWRIIGVSAEAEPVVRARHVVLSLPADATATLIGSLDTELADLLRGIDYAPLAVVHLGFARSTVHHPLDGMGFLTPRREGLPVSGCLWMSGLFPDRAPPDKVLLSSYLGGARQPVAAAWDDARSVATVLTTLQPLLGIQGDPEMAHIDRHNQGLPLYHGAYQGRLKMIGERLRHLPGLHLEANYRGGVSVRDRIVRGHAAARRILGDIEQTASLMSKKRIGTGLDELSNNVPATAKTTG